MTDQEPAEEERKKARSPDDGLGAAGGGGGRSSLALPGASSAPSSPSHSSPSWTRAKENEQQFEEDSHVGVAEERRRPSPHAHLVDPPIPSDCSAENDSEWECEKPVDSHPGPEQQDVVKSEMVGSAAADQQEVIQPPQPAIPHPVPISASPDQHGAAAELVLACRCTCEETGKTCHHTIYWKGTHIINGDQHK
jgi:hypothetical protein